MGVHPDGTSIAIHEAENLVLVRLDGGERRMLCRLAPEDEPIQWGPGGRSIYVRHGTGERVQVDRLDLATGQRKLWREFSLDPSGRNFGMPLVLTPDGSAYAYTYNRGSSELYLVKELV